MRQACGLGALLGALVSLGAWTGALTERARCEAGNGCARAACRNRWHRDDLRSRAARLRQPRRALLCPAGWPRSRYKASQPRHR